MHALFELIMRLIVRNVLWTARLLTDLSALSCCVYTRAEQPNVTRDVESVDLTALNDVILYDCANFFFFRFHFSRGDCVMDLYSV